MDNLKEKLNEFALVLATDLEVIAQKNFFLEDEKQSAEVNTLVFEYFFPQLEIAFYPVNADQDQLGYKDLLNGQGIFKDISQTELQQLDKERDKLSKTYQDLGNIFVNWFAEIWEKSGGKSLNIPTFLLTDDESMTKFDLNKKTWIKDESYK